MQDRNPLRRQVMGHVTSARNLNDMLRRTRGRAKLPHLAIPELAHVFDGLELEIGDHVTREFEQLVASVVKPKIYGEETDGATLDDLRDNDLLPKQKIEFGDVTYYISKVFEVKSKGDMGKKKKKGRPSFVYYLTRTNPEGKKEIFVHCSYKSNSENEWRVISHTTPNKSWYGKGFSELDTGLPLEITDLIEDMYAKGRASRLAEVARKVFLDIPVRNGGEEWEDPLEPFGGSIVIVCRDPETKTETRTLTKRGTMKDPEQEGTREIRGFPERIGEFTSDDPESFVFAVGFKPELDKLVKVKETENPLYSKVTSYYFLSENEKVGYCFHIDGQKRAWVGAAQVRTPKVTRFGVKNVELEFGEIWKQQYKMIIKMGLFTPAFEYSDHIISEYKGSFSSRNTNYADASRFTERIPIIAEFKRRHDEGTLKLRDHLPDAELIKLWREKRKLDAEGKLRYAGQLLVSAPNAQDAEAKIKQAQYVLYLAKKSGGISEGLRKRLDYCVKVAGEISANISAAKE